MVETGDGSNNVTRIPRPQRWDDPFSSEMTNEDVDKVLETTYFSAIDPNRFPQNITLRDVVLNDCRVCEFDKGEIIVREGDYGSSAFYILSGKVKVLFKDLPAEMLGRSKPRKKSLMQAITQSLKKSPYPESRDYENKQSRSSSDGSQGSITKQTGFNIFLQDIPGVLDEEHTDTMIEGEVFGELGALARTPRTATIIAEEQSTLLEIRWQGLRELRNYAPELKKHIDSLYRDRSLVTHFRNTHFLANLPDDALQKVADETQFLTIGNFDWYSQYKSKMNATSSERLKIEPVIAAEGDYPNGIYLIRNGFARVSKKYNHGERTISYLGKGDLFGLPELLKNWLKNDTTTMQQTLRAVGYVDVLFIPTSTVEQYILNYWDRNELEQLVEQTMTSVTADLEKGKLNDETLEFLVENRFINGSATMLIDMNRCTQCDDCVRACASTHDSNPRFVRNGPVVDHVMIANACMHCIDPVCMIGCPTGAIHRNSAEGQVVINDDTCIGCSTCANSCPYHNIQMVSIQDRKGQLILSEESGVPIQKATKCDLCVEQLGGPACARACPHDAMIRADMKDFSSLTRFFNR